MIASVGTLFTEILICASMIFANPALGLLLQDKSNECKQRNSVGSHRMFAFGFPGFMATHIALWLTIYSHALKKRRDEKLRHMKKGHCPVLQESSLISSQS